MKLSKLLAGTMFTLLATLPMANAQTSSATITGSLADPAGSAIVGANVQLTNDLTKLENEFKTDSDGRFQFEVEAGDYTFHVAQTGFKAYTQKVNVGLAERFDMHEIKLTIGDVTTSVEVEGEIAHVQTDSSDRTITVNETQIEDTPTAGRNFLNILRSLPGTAQTTTNDGRGGSGGAGVPNQGGGGPTVNGGAGQMLVTINGIGSVNSGSPQVTGGYQSPSVDAIGEVQLMVSNYTAEYGARNGGQINVVFKSGTQQFHGTAYYYWRHEDMDANEWFNNKNTETINGVPGQATPKPLYRWQNPGGTIGGPLYIPKHFNRNRNKLFFFYSDDELFHKGTYGPNYSTMPTALERNGNFSQTVTTTGTLIPILNPLNGQKQFSGNVIPASQLSPQGYAILNLFPLPNTTDPSGQRQYNYVNSFTQESPLTDRILRVDMPLGQKTSFYVSALQDYYGTKGEGAQYGSGGAAWGQFITDWGVPNASIAANLVHTFRPNLINEFTAGINRAFERVSVPDTQTPCTGSIGTIATGSALPYSCSLQTNPNLKGPNGEAVTFPNLFPGANAANLLPNISFGTAGAFTVQSAGQANQPNTPGFGFDTTARRWPFFGSDQVTNITDTMTWIKGGHTVKGGFYVEHDSRNDPVDNGTYETMGSLYFGSDLANSNDTGFSYSNAAVGSLQAYGVDNRQVINHSRYTTVEFFLQDAWKITRRLTLDYGVRIQSIGPEVDEGANLGLFAASSYNAKSAGQILYPALVGGKKVSENPVTGAIYPYALVNTIDPASYSGAPLSGLKSYTTSFWNRGKPDIGPRIGFAYDVLGNGKLALRGGFGIFYGRATSVDQVGATALVPPNFLTPAYVYPTFTSLATSTARYVPQTVYGGTQDILNPQTLQWSFGAQRDLGKGTILDVSYLGWVTHHGFNQTGYDFNIVPPYTDWKPTPGPGTNSCGQVIAYLDPTASAVNPTTCTGGAFYSSSIIRSITGYSGYSSIYASTNQDESNYNALQVQFNKRFGKKLQFGANYTWSKNLAYSPGGSNQDLPNQLTYNVSSSNRPQVVNVNFGYKLPNGTGLLPGSAKNYETRLVLDGWNINGVLSFYDGTPFTVGCAATGTPIGYWTGSPVDTPALRCQMNGSVYLPAGATPSSVGSVADPRLWWPINGGPGVNNGAAGFQLPSANSFGIGNTPLTLFYGPGFENADLSVYKEITLGKETRVLQFRAEAFNTFNHMNPSNPNSSLTYNFTTGAQTNASFGTITSTQNTARHMALSLRLRF